MPQLTKLGVCNNCGECCYVWSNTLKRFHWCEHYRFTRPNGHCSIHNKKVFPKECREFPMSPEDLERVHTVCPIKFVDDKGKVVDCWMNPTVKLTKLS